MRKIFYLAISALLLMASVSAAELTVEINDRNGDRLNAEFILEQEGNQLNQTTGQLTATLNDAENYTIRQQIDSGPDVEIYNFSIDQDLNLKPTIYMGENPQDNFLTGTDPVYFIDQDFGFSKAEITVSRTQPDSIAKCNSITSKDCSSWTVQDTSKYETSYSDSTFEYNVTSFSGYTSGVEAPNPQIENIQIYNVTDAQNQRTDGNLVDEGFNKTFQIDQKSPNEYRFKFNITNNGSRPWTLTSSDVLQHRNLNQDWIINESDDIFYTVNETTYKGGTFSGGEVEWNTGNAGKLPVNESMAAQYIVNVSQNSTNTFDQVFYASTTSGTSDRDYHELRTVIYGYLNANIDSPVNNSVLQNNRAFTLNGTVNCVEGDCGDITATPRQSTTSGQERFTGIEFEVTDQNNTCFNLLEGQQCTVEWNVNATADPDTFHELDILFESNYSDIASNDTKDNLVEVRDILLIDLDWNTVDFGVLDPGEKQNPANRNDQGYNLTVEETSNEVDNLWFKASSLVSQANSNYTIRPGNMTYWNESTYSDSKNFNSSYSLLDSNLKPGTTKKLFFWLNVPYGIISGGYNGTMTFKANQTQ